MPPSKWPHVYVLYTKMMHCPKPTRQYLRDNERVAMFKKVWEGVCRGSVNYLLVLNLDTGLGVVSGKTEGHLRQRWVVCDVSTDCIRLVMELVTSNILKWRGNIMLRVDPGRFQEIGISECSVRYVKPFQRTEVQHRIHCVHSNVCGYSNPSKCMITQSFHCNYLARGDTTQPFDI